MLVWSSVSVAALGFSETSSTFWGETFPRFSGMSCNLLLGAFGVVSWTAVSVGVFASTSAPGGFQVRGSGSRGSTSIADAGATIKLWLSEVSKDNGWNSKRGAKREHFLNRLPKPGMRTAGAYAVTYGF